MNKSETKNKGKHEIYNYLEELKRKTNLNLKGFKSKIYEANLSTLYSTLKKMGNFIIQIGRASCRERV